jgi:hypothetical protein
LSIDFFLYNINLKQDDIPAPNAGIFLYKSNKRKQLIFGN